MHKRIFTVPLVLAGLALAGACTPAGEPATGHSGPEVRSPNAAAAHVDYPVYNTDDPSDPAYVLTCSADEEPNTYLTGCVPVEWTEAAECETEYAEGPCVWLAADMGNGEGTSFYVDGEGRLTSLLVTDDGEVFLG